MSSSDHEPMPFALFNIYLLLIHGVFPELAPLHRAGVMCFVGIYSKQLLFVAHFFFFDQGMESAPIGRHENLPYLLDRFGIIPDNKYPV